MDIVGLRSFAAQHYLMHLLRPKLEESKTRVVFVSSGGVRLVKDPSKEPLGAFATDSNG